MKRATTILTAGVLAGAALLATGCETTTTRSMLTSATPIAAEDAFASGAGQAPTPRTLYRMAGILAAQQKYAGAEAVHRSTIRRYPDFLPAYNELAQIQIRRGAVGNAIATLDEALVVAPRDPLVHNNRGMSLMLVDRYGEARESFALAATLDPANARYAANHALAAGLLGDYDEAYDIYQGLLQPARAHHNLAVICEARGDHERATLEFALAAGYEPPVAGDAVQMGAREDAPRTSEE